MQCAAVSLCVVEHLQSGAVAKGSSFSLCCGAVAKRSSCTLRELLSFTCCRLCCCPLCGTNKQTRAAAPLTLRQCRHPSSSRQICAIFFPELSKASLHCAHCMAARHICICLLGRVQASVLPQEGRSRWGREGGWENN